MESYIIFIVGIAVAVVIPVVTLSYFYFRRCWEEHSNDAFGSDLPIYV